MVPSGHYSGPLNESFGSPSQVRAVEKIAELFKDSTTNINVRNITTNPIQITWTNTSLINSRSTTCPKEELEQIAEVSRTEVLFGKDKKRRFVAQTNVFLR